MITDRERRVLNQQDIEVVRARHNKEITVTADPNRPIAFGTEEVRLGAVEEWLSEKAKSDNRWKVVTGIAAVIAAATSIFGVYVGIWQARISSDTEKRDLRAYVYAAVHANPFSPANDKPPDRYAISLAVVNSGKTWARKLQIRKNIVRDQTAEPFNSAELNKAATSPMVLGPGQSLEFQLDSIPLSDLPKLVNNKQSYFYVVWMTYEDALSDPPVPRQTQLSVHTNYDLEGAGHVSIGYMPTHNCSDDDCPK